MQQRRILARRTAREGTRPNRGGPKWERLHRVLITVILLGLVPTAHAKATATATATATEPAIAQASAPTLRVGTSGDYAPFSVVDPARPDERTGFDVAVATAYAAARGLDLVWVPFAWPDLIRDLEAGRFDVAMSGVTVRPERSLAGAFSVPVAVSGAVVLVPGDGPLQGLEQLNASGVRIAVNQGGHLERVTRARFPAAEILALPDNLAVPTTLTDGAADAVVTDDLEAPHWQERVEGLRALGPFTRDAKGYLVAATRRDLAGDLDSWLLASEADGSLQQLRKEHLGRPAALPPPADPLSALMIGMQERLSLMPRVAWVKRAKSTAVSAPAQEDRVLEAAVSASWASSAVLQRPVPDASAVRRLFRAQMAAARAIQLAVLEDDAPAPAGATDASLEELRAALGRIGDRIAGLLTLLPTELAADVVRSHIDATLEAPGLSDELRAEIGAALVAVAEEPRSQP